ncbi:hypothetical protein [Bradyrhizobium sp. sGM-13]|uniref:hypothetical protein n=1 Tax=Bradyrhizobium sp. sGM-13 TaxID=2831781 RepID=UPI001BCE1594|nr:hypothetical protein [Bradyrhizobium sp. sGM-13]
MAAFEKLGPHCKAALNDSVFPWSSIAVLRRFAQTKRDPSNADHDKDLADELRAIDKSRTEERKAS